MGGETGKVSCSRYSTKRDQRLDPTGPVAGDAVVDHCVGSVGRLARLSVNDQCQFAFSVGRYSTLGNIDAKSIFD